MSTIAPPLIDMPPADLIANLRFVLDADKLGAYRFRHVRLRSKVNPTAEAWMTTLLEGHSVAEALTELDSQDTQPAKNSIREFLLNLERLLPAPAGRLSPRHAAADDSLAVTEACHDCARHRMAALRRRNGGQDLGVDQCECQREYKLRNAQRDAVALTLHKIAG